MIKRDKRNIGKQVRIHGHKDFNNRLGVVKGFRGDDRPGDPWVSVYVHSIHCIYPFQGSHLEVVKENQHA